MQLEDIMLNEVSQAQREATCFLSYMESPKDKHAQNKHDHIQTHM
jgi:hypothetical protein